MLRKTIFIIAVSTLSSSMMAIQANTSFVLGSNALAQTNLLQNATLPSGNFLFKSAIVVTPKNGAAISHRYTSNSSIKDIIESFTDIESSTDFKNKNIDWKTADAQAKISLRGIPITANLVSTNTVQTLTVNILGDVKIFTHNTSVRSSASGTTANEDVYHQLQDWLLGKVGSDGSEILTKLADSFVSQTAVDPVAGNPNSFASQLIGNGYMSTQQTLFSSRAAGLSFFSIAPSWSDMGVKNMSQDVDSDSSVVSKNISVPISYTHYFKNNSISIYMPLFYNRLEQASSYSAALGANFTHVLWRGDAFDWAVGPNLEGGAVGSIDLGSGTIAVSGGLDSDLQYKQDNVTYSMTNLVDYMSTIPMQIGSLETPYKLRNVATKNGVSVKYDFSNHYDIGLKLSRFDIVSGNDWYISSYNSVGLFAAKLAQYNGVSANLLALGADYDFGDHGYKNVNLSLTLTL